MEEENLKTSTGQRIIISIIAILMLGSILAGYALVIIAGNKSTETDSEITSAQKLAYESAYADKLTEFKAATSGEYAKFSQFNSQITTYDENQANSNGVQSKDLLTGDGRELTSGDTDYLAFYVGWCADGTIFDSSFDDESTPTGFSKALAASLGMIDGWTTGVVGMKLGGVRVLTVPGENAYADQMEICGGYNKPLKFMILAVENADPLKTLANEIDTAYLRVQYAYYGLDYDKIYSK